MPSTDGRRTVHTNLGWTHDRRDGSDHLTWGVGLELEQTSRLFWVAESYGRDDGDPWYQAGVRFWIWPDRVQIDTTIGGRFGDGRDARWVSVGLPLLSPAFLP